MTQPAASCVDDGSPLVEQAVKLLQAVMKKAGVDLAIEPVADFLAAAEKTPTAQEARLKILTQATLMFNHLYPHMPFKTEIYHFTHPSDFLAQNVTPKVDSLGEWEFHDWVVAAFSLVRDAHTLYVKPSPFKNAVAFLPFEMRPYTDATGRHYVVSRVLSATPGGGLGHPFFAPGAEILQWGAEPIDSHVQRAAGRLPGGNPSALFMRGAFHCTVRPLAYVQIPFDDEMPQATIRYRLAESCQEHVITFPWLVATGLNHGTGFATTAFSVSPLTRWNSICGHLLHCAYAAPTPTPANEPEMVSSLPGVFVVHHSGNWEDLRDPKNPNARFGYVRIRAFSDDSAMNSADAMVSEFRRILTLLDQTAPDGLVLDIRSNPGGEIPAAEQMLQMLTPRSIQPQLFHLANTPAVLALLDKIKSTNLGSLSPDDQARLIRAQVELGPWLHDASGTPLPHGDRLTSGQPLTPPASANAIGQIYQGPVVLLVDGLTYSAADIFAAGFQDHGIGVVFGLNDTTGGGGANLWGHADLVSNVGPLEGTGLEDLPGDASMTLAVRRCSRVELFAGQPVEDVGVKVDRLYHPDSAEDVIHDCPGMIREARALLAAMPVFRLDVSQFASDAAGSIAVTLATRNLSELRFFVDGSQVLSVPAPAAAQTVVLPAVPQDPSPLKLRIEGYAAVPGANGGRSLVAVRNIPLREVAEQPDPTTDPLLLQQPAP